MTARFGFTLTRPMAAPELLDRVFDLARHDREVPFTRVTPAAGCPAAGDRFVAVTRLGPVRLVDEMVVEEWSQSGDGSALVRIRKEGSPLGGEIVASVRPVDADRSVLVWDQTVRVRRIPDVFVRLAAPLIALGYRTTMARIVDGDAPAD